MLGGNKYPLFQMIQTASCIIFKFDCLSFFLQKLYTVYHTIEYCQVKGDTKYLVVTSFDRNTSSQSTFTDLLLEASISKAFKRTIPIRILSKFEPDSIQAH